MYSNYEDQFIDEDAAHRRALWDVEVDRYIDELIDREAAANEKKAQEQINSTATSD